MGNRLGNREGDEGPFKDRSARMGMCVRERASGLLKNFHL